MATIATVAVLTWPLATSGGATWEADALLAAAVLLMVAVYMRIHLVLSRPAETPLRHQTTVPPLGIAAMAAVADLAFELVARGGGTGGAPPPPPLDGAAGPSE